MQLTFKTHGNYCGPNYTSGKFNNTNPNWNHPPTDKLDNFCRTHDYLYSKGDYLKADTQFIKDTFYNKNYLHSLGISSVWLLRKLNILKQKEDMTKSPQARKRYRQKRNALIRAAKKSNGTVTARSNALANRPNNRSRRSRRRQTKQRPRTSIPGATFRPNPISVSRVVARKGIRSFKNVRDGIVITGSELIGPLNITTANIGDNLVNYTIAPQTMNGSTLQIEAAFYERYLFESVFCTYVPNVGTTEPGSLIGYINYDPDDPQGTGGINANQAASAYGSKDFNVYTPVRINEHAIPRQEAYYTSPSPDQERRFDTQGVFRIVANSIFNNQEAKSYGNVYLHYRIRFFVRKNTVAGLSLGGVTYFSAAAPISGTNIAFYPYQTGGNQPPSLAKLINTTTPSSDTDIIYSMKRNQLYNVTFILNPAQFTTLPDRLVFTTNSNPNVALPLSTNSGIYTTVIVTGAGTVGNSFNTVTFNKAAMIFGTSASLAATIYIKMILTPIQSAPLATQPSLNISKDDRIEELEQQIKKITTLISSIDSNKLKQIMDKLDDQTDDDSSSEEIVFKKVKSNNK